MGRKIVVLATSRIAAARAIKSVLFETFSGYSVSRKSTWFYVDNKNQEHGPFGFEKMAKWYNGGYFGEGSMPIRLQTENDSSHNATAWVPVWILEFLEPEAGNVYDHEGDDMDWEMTVKNISDLRIRDQVGLKSDLLMSDFPLSELEAVKPMDYDAITRPLDVHNIHIVVILDTNVLLSHFSLLERTFQELLAAESDSTQECQVFEIMALVPWVVLNELDHFKSLEDHQGSSARYALKRIKILATKRDSFLHLQNGSQHQQVVDRITLPSQKQSLRNDDFILQTCLSFSRGLVMNQEGLKPFVLLISNDQGLQVRATANGIACIRAVDFAVSRRRLTQTLLNLEAKLEQARRHEATKGNEKQPDAMSGHKHYFERNGKTEQANLLKFQHEPTIIEKQISPREQYESVQSIIVDSLGTFVMYIRQQDLGELWEELLEDELKPPWDAHQVLRVIIRHNTPFWYACILIYFQTFRKLWSCIHSESVAMQGHI
jgi:rRNA-processing protein FCF1